MSLNVLSLTATNAIITLSVVPRITLQMSIEAIAPAYSGVSRYIILSPTTGFLSSSSGSFIITPTSGRVSVPVSGIYNMTAWVYLNAATWIYFTINGTQTVNDLETYMSATSSGPRTVASVYNAVGATMTSWTGYLSTTDYFYIGLRDGVGTIITTVPRGFCITLMNQTQ